MSVDTICRSYVCKKKVLHEKEITEYLFLHSILIIYYNQILSKMNTNKKRHALYFYRYSH